MCEKSLVERSESQREKKKKKESLVFFGRRLRLPQPPSAGLLSPSVLFYLYSIYSFRRFTFFPLVVVRLSFWEAVASVAPVSPAFVSGRRFPLRHRRLLLGFSVRFLRSMNLRLICTLPLDLCLELHVVMLATEDQSQAF